MNDKRRTEITSSGRLDPVAPSPHALHELALRPELATELLEPDQTVAAKRARLGRKRLTRSERALLWALRIYVIAMQIVVLITVIRALRAPH